MLAGDDAAIVLNTQETRVTTWTLPTSSAIIIGATVQVGMHGRIVAEVAAADGSNIAAPWETVFCGDMKLDYEYQLGCIEQNSNTVIAFARRD